MKIGPEKLLERIKWSLENEHENFSVVLILKKWLESSDYLTIENISTDTWQEYMITNSSCKDGYLVVTAHNYRDSLPVFMEFFYNDY